MHLFLTESTIILQYLTDLIIEHETMLNLSLSMPSIPLTSSTLTSPLPHLHYHPHPPPSPLHPSTFSLSTITPFIPSSFTILHHHPLYPLSTTTITTITPFTSSPSVPSSAPSHPHHPHPFTFSPSSLLHILTTLVPSHSHHHHDPSISSLSIFILERTKELLLRPCGCPLFVS